MDSTIRPLVDCRTLLRGLTVSFGMRSDRVPEKRRWRFLLLGLAPPLETSPPRHPFTQTVLFGNEFHFRGL